MLVSSVWNSAVSKLSIMPKRSAPSADQDSMDGDALMIAGLLQQHGIAGKCYGFKSSAALKVAMLMGTEKCSWMIIHLPPILRKPTVARIQTSVFSPLVLAPVI